MHTKAPWVVALLHIVLGAGFLLLGLSGTLSETLGWGFVVGGAMYAPNFFVPLFNMTARQYVVFVQWYIPLICLTFSVAFVMEGSASGDFFFFVLWTPLQIAMCLVLRFRPGWHLLASTAIPLLGCVVTPPVRCIASTNLAASCVATEYRTWAPVIGIFGWIMLDHLAKTLAKHTMARRAFKASRGLHRF